MKPVDELGRPDAVLVGTHALLLLTQGQPSSQGPDNVVPEPDKKRISNRHKRSAPKIIFFPGPTNVADKMSGEMFIYLVARQGPDTSSPSGTAIGPLIVTVMTLFLTSEVFGSSRYSFEKTFKDTFYTLSHQLFLTI